MEQKITFHKIILFSFLSIVFSQVEWVDSDGEKSFIFIKEQYDSLLTKSEELQLRLNKKILKVNQIQKDLDYCKFHSSKESSSNFIINQSIPLKSENHWIWFSLGIVGGFTACQLLNL